MFLCVKAVRNVHVSQVFYINIEILEVVYGCWNVSTRLQTQLTDLGTR